MAPNWGVFAKCKFDLWFVVGFFLSRRWVSSMRWDLFPAEVLGGEDPPFRAGIKSLQSHSKHILKFTDLAEGAC